MTHARRMIETNPSSPAVDVEALLECSRPASTALKPVVTHARGEEAGGRLCADETLDARGGKSFWLDISQSRYHVPTYLDAVVGEGVEGGRERPAPKRR